MATLVMSPELERDVKRLAEATGVSLEEAIAAAVRERLDQFRSQDHPREIDWTRIREIQQRVAGTVDYSKSDDELLGYDETGAPEQPSAW
ncbi:type II toxin-antitoxin system VapB family antitoxin [Terriglobus sp.]|uniref:type II toxin-antitoxin system VapB family antitoxin n=1 Tax=Terriglobus sp. TaxID=1889013 RepID=UPI003B001340